MTISERQYWLLRARNATNRTGTTSATTVRQRENWTGFRNRQATRSTTTVSEDTSRSTSTSPRQRRRERN
jgi:hypothetical protein